MRAILLAAGRGSRLGDLTNDAPKGMLRLHNKPLLEWQMQAIKRAGINEISIIKGYLGHTLSYDVNYFENFNWHKTNMLSTLLCADSWLTQYNCIVSYSDIIYQHEVIQQLQESDGDISIAYDPNWLWLWQQRFDDPLSDAETFKYKNNQLLDIGSKTNDLNEIQGQYMGLLKFTVAGWQQTKEFLHGLSSDVISKMDITSLLKLMLKNNFNISVVPINTPWCEIDSITDYQLCQKIFKSSIY